MHNVEGNVDYCIVVAVDDEDEKLFVNYIESAEVYGSENNFFFLNIVEGINCFNFFYGV